MAKINSVQELLVQRTTRTGSLETSEGRNLFKASVQADIANLVSQHNQVLYPLLSSLRSRNDVFNALETGIGGNSLYSYITATAADGTVYWDSVNARPRSLKESIDVILAELNRLDNSIIALTDFPEYDDTALSAFITQTDNNLRQLTKDTMGTVYSLDDDGAPDLTYPLSQHIDALGGLFSGFPGTGNTYSDTYPDISLSVNLTDINVDGQLPSSAVAGLDSELTAIRTFIGKDSAGAVLPNYSDYGELYYIEDEDSLEKSIQLLDKALASKPDEPLELIYRPWGSDDPANVYTDWSELMVEVNARKDDTTVTVLFDASDSPTATAYITIPAGTYDFNNCIWRGVPISAQNNRFASSVTIVEDGSESDLETIAPIKMPCVVINNAVNITNLWRIEDLFVMDNRTTAGDYSSAIRNNIAPDTTTFGVSTLNNADWVFPVDSVSAPANQAMMVIKNSILSKRLGASETVNNVNFITFVCNTGDIALPDPLTHAVTINIKNSFVCGVSFEQDSSVQDVAVILQLNGSILHHITKLEDVDLQIWASLDTKSRIVNFVDGFTDTVDADPDTAWGSPSYVVDIYPDFIYGNGNRLSDASQLRPGLVPSGDGLTTEFLAGDGVWRTPSSGADASAAYVTIGHPTGLTGERSLAGTAGQITVTDGGANNDVTLALVTTAVTPGAYTAANITVDAYGRLTAATNGASPGTGPFSTTAGVTSNAPGTPTTDDFAFGNTELDGTGTGGSERFQFDKSKAAFRAGDASTTQWSDANTGATSVALGQDGIAQQDYSAVVGGRTNQVLAGTSTNDSGIFGGNTNTITQASSSVILGGNSNIIDNNDASGDEGLGILGGNANTIGGVSSTVAYSVILGGSTNTIGATANANNSLIGASLNSEADAPHSVILGSITAEISAGAEINAIIASSESSITSVDGFNVILGSAGGSISESTAGSGIYSSAESAVSSTGNLNVIVANTSSNIDSTGSNNIIAGGTGNEILGTSGNSVILGGETNTINVVCSTNNNVIIGGEDNQILNTDGPTISTAFCVIGGGSGNVLDTHSADGIAMTIAGGKDNYVDGTNCSVISGGELNVVYALDGISPNGNVNTDEVTHGTVVGGNNNIVSYQGTGGTAMGMYAHAHTRGMVAMGGGIWAGETAGGAQSAIVTLFGSLGVSNVDYYIYQNGEGAKTTATSPTGYGIVVPPNMSLAITWQAVGRTGSAGVPITTTARGFAVIDRDGSGDPVIVQDTTATVYNGNALFTGGGGTVVPVISTNGTPDYSIIFKIKKGSNAAWNAGRWVITCVCTYIAYEV